MGHISMATRDELVVALAGRYASSGRKHRGRILDEFVAVSGFHRKHAMRLLRAGQSGRGAGPRPARGSGWLRPSHPLRCAPRPRGRQVGRESRLSDRTGKRVLQTCAYPAGTSEAHESTMIAAYVIPSMGAGIPATSEQTSSTAVTGSYRKLVDKASALGSI
jgi:hypothetical protein